MYKIRSIIASAICLLALSATGSLADITFTRQMPAQGQSNYVYSVRMAGGGSCTMNWNQSSCTIAGKEIGDRLIEVYWGKNSRGMIQRISFWVNRPALWKEPNFSVQIPTAEIDFDFDKSASVINGKGEYDIAILSSDEISEYGRLSNTPNSGPGFFGHVIDTTYAGGNCNGTGCTTRMLAGCYTVVMARPHFGNKASIYFAGSFCVSDDDEDAIVELPVK